MRGGNAWRASLGTYYTIFRIRIECAIDWDGFDKQDMGWKQVGELGVVMDEFFACLNGDIFLAWCRGMGARKAVA